MSREIRRVPIDFQHPLEHNPNWERQLRNSFNTAAMKPSRLHLVTERFIPLRTPSISTAQETWDQGRVFWCAGAHPGMLWILEYHSSSGWVNRQGVREAPVPYEIWDRNRDEVIREFFPESASDLQDDYCYEEYAGRRPEVEDYMPDFDTSDNELGWCLYETVSEGTPVTPVFATAEELTDWLCDKGQDYDQVPMRRSSVEAIVSYGYTLGSAFTIDGKLHASDMDADLLPGMKE